MNQKLKQAIVATRSGQTKEAQLLLTQVLQENPNETQAWYLLSMLVDSESKKVSYLEKVIALEPTHQKAQEQLAQLSPSTAERTFPDTDLPQPTPDADVLAQSEEDTIPDWMEELKLEAGSDPSLTEEESDYDDEKTLPDWLKEPVQDNWIESEQPTLISESTKPSSPAEAEDKPQQDEPAKPEKDKVSTAAISEKPTDAPAPHSNAAKTKSLVRMNFLLFILIIGAIVTFLLLIYMLFTTYFSG